MTTVVNLPELGESVESGDVVRIIVSVGDAVGAEQSVMEIETDKAAVEIPAGVAGTVVELHVQEGDTIEVGQPFITIDASGAPEATAKPSAELTTAPAPAKDAEPPRPAPKRAAAGPRPEPRLDDTGPVLPHAGPAVRRLARELGVSLNLLRGTGPLGRILPEDVQRAASGPSAEPAHPDLPDFAQWGEVDRQKMSRLRKTAAKHLSAAWNQIPHVTQFDRADITEVDKIRKSLKEKAKAAGGSITMTAILIRVLADAMAEFPQFNASIDMKSQEVIYKKYTHIGVAVDTDRGLVVPVIRDVGSLSAIDIGVALTEISEKARDGKLTLEEMRGGCFTISNLGGIGGTFFTPIVNHPEVAILGVSRSTWEPVWNGEAFDARYLLPLSLSYDHRLIDGADAVRFTRWVAERLETPDSVRFE